MLQHLFANHDIEGVRGRPGIAGHQIVDPIGRIALGSIEVIFLHVGRFDLDVVAMRSRFEMPKQYAGGAADVDHLQLPPLPRRFGGPRVDVVRERVIARLAQAVIFLPARIYSKGVFRFGDEIRGQLDLEGARRSFPTNDWPM